MSDAIKCNDCGNYIDANAKICPACNKVEPQESQSDIPFSEIILTTAPSIEGYKITKTIEIVSAECVFGMNIFRDMFAGVRDIFGGRSEASQKVLKDAKNKCLRELKKEAYLSGGNAVIGVDLDYSEFSGRGKSMLFLVASGTAVTIEENNDK